MMTQHPTTRILIESLRPHADQRLFDGTLAEVDEHALREDLRTNGQRDAIKIVADGTIIDGYQQARLLEEVGHTEVLTNAIELAADVAAAHDRPHEGGLMDN